MHIGLIIDIARDFLKIGNIKTYDMVIIEVVEKGLYAVVLPIPMITMAEERYII